MTVYFKVQNMIVPDGKFVWKWFTDLDPKSNTFDFLIRRSVRSLCQEFDGIDGYITKSQATVKGDWIVEFMVITKSSIKEDTINVRDSGKTH